MPLKKQENIKDDVKNMINSSVLKTSEKKRKMDDAVLIKINKKDKETLTKHFSDKGTNLSNGIRMLIYEYLQKNNLI